MRPRPVAGSISQRVYALASNRRPAGDQVDDAGMRFRMPSMRSRETESATFAWRVSVQVRTKAELLAVGPVVAESQAEVVVDFLEGHGVAHDGLIKGPADGGIPAGIAERFPEAQRLARVDVHGAYAGR